MASSYYVYFLGHERCIAPVKPFKFHLSRADRVELAKFRRVKEKIEEGIQRKYEQKEQA